jgi:hypothetical protein
MVETYVTVEGKPSVLRIESDDADESPSGSIPPFLRVLREITNEDAYETKSIALKTYEMPVHDRKAIAEKVQEMQLRDQGQ